MNYGAGKLKIVQNSTLKLNLTLKDKYNISNTARSTIASAKDNESVWDINKA